MDQRIMDILFVAAVVVLSYIASVHLITNRVVERLQNQSTVSTARAVQMSGPVAVPVRPNVRSIANQRNLEKPVPTYVHKAKHGHKAKVKARLPASHKKHIKHKKIK